MSKDLHDLADDKIEQFHREYDEAIKMVKFQYFSPKCHCNY